MKSKSAPRLKSILKTQEENECPPKEQGQRDMGDQDCLQIGDGKGTDIFILSIALQDATNLHSILSSAASKKTKLDKRFTKGFWLSYSLFGVVVQTDVFTHLEAPDFPPIKDSFRLQSCLSDMRTFFQTQQPTLSVYLCTEKAILADATIPLAILVNEELFQTAEPSIKTAQIEASYAMTGSSKAAIQAAVYLSWHSTSLQASENPVHTDSPCPTVDQVAMQLQIEYFELDREYFKSRVSDDIHAELIVDDESASASVRVVHYTDTTVALKAFDMKIQREVDPTICSALNMSIQLCQSRSDKVIARTASPLKVNANQLLTESARVRLDDEFGEQRGCCVISCQHFDPHANETYMVKKEPDNSHLYLLQLNLPAIKGYPNECEVCFQYQDPFYLTGTIQTMPTYVGSRGQVQLQHTSCTFHLVCRPGDLKHLLDTTVSVFCLKQSTKGEAEVIGTTIFSLSYLFYSNASYRCTFCKGSDTYTTLLAAAGHCRFKHDSKCIQERKQCCVWLPLVATSQSSDRDNSSQKMGSVRMEATISDTGIVSESTAQEIAVKESAENSITSTSEQPVHNNNHENDTCNLLSSSQVSSSIGDSDDSDKEQGAGATFNEERVHPECQKTSAQAMQKTEETTTIQVRRIQHKIELEKKKWLKEQQEKQKEWKRWFAKREKDRMEALEVEWARREEERISALRAAQTDYQTLEQQLQTSLKELQSRERKLADSESKLKREQEKLKEKGETMRKRLQLEHTHTVTMAKTQVEEQKVRAAALQDQLKEAEERWKQISAAFDSYREQQESVPEAELRKEINQLHSTVSVLEKEKVAAEQMGHAAQRSTASLRKQLEKMAQLVYQEKMRKEVEIAEELEKLRMRNRALEEKDSLRGNREELTNIKQHLKHLQETSLSRRDRPLHEHNRGRSNTIKRRHSTRNSGDRSRSCASEESYSSKRRDKHESFQRKQRGDKRLAITSLDPEIKRLIQEKESLLKNGNYDEDSYLVQELDRAIRKAQE